MTKNYLFFTVLFGALWLSTLPSHAHAGEGGLRIGAYTGFGHLHGDLYSESNNPVTPIIFRTGSDISAERSSKPLVGLVFGFDQFVTRCIFVGGEVDLGFHFYQIDDDFQNIGSGNDFTSRFKHQGALISSVVFGYQLAEQWDIRAKFGVSVHSISATAVNTTDDLKRSRREFNIGFVPGLELAYHWGESKIVMFSVSYDIQRDLTSTVLDTVQGGNPTFNNVLRFNGNILNVKIGFSCKI